MTYLSREMSLEDLSESNLIITHMTNAQINENKKQVEVKSRFYLKFNLSWCNDKSSLNHM